MMHEQQDDQLFLLVSWQTKNTIGSEYSACRLDFCSTVNLPRGTALSRDLRLYILYVRMRALAGHVV